MPDPSSTTSRIPVSYSGPPPAVSRPEPYPIEWLRPSPWQPRHPFSAADLQPLVNSIRRYGFFGSLPARRDPTDPQGPLQFLFGHRRLEAARLAGLRTVPIALIEGVDDEAARLLVFVENDTFAALSPLEQAEYLEHLLRDMGWSFREAAERLGKSAGWIQNRVRLLRLPPHMRQAAHTGAVDFSLLSWMALRPEEEWAALFARATRGELQLEDLRRLGQRQASRGDDAASAPAPAIAGEPAPIPPVPPTPPGSAAEDVLRRRLPTPGRSVMPAVRSTERSTRTERAGEGLASEPTLSDVAERETAGMTPRPPRDPVALDAPDGIEDRLGRVAGLVAELERTCAGLDRPALSGDQRRRMLELREAAWRALSPE